MFENIITFSAKKDYLDSIFKEDFPEPIVKNIPDWFKELDAKYDHSIKNCMPFLDSLTYGYVLKMPQDFDVQHGTLNEDKKLDSNRKWSLNDPNFLNYASKDWSNDSHSLDQVGGKCPFAKKNRYLPIYKINNPWIIKTPPGYSCLFVPPLNNSDDRFEILSGIIDTDNYPLAVNFPFVLNGDKYKTLNTIIKRGTPIAQVIPFKRSTWKMQVSEIKNEKWNNMMRFFRLSFNKVYRNKWWNKKRCK
jgi:hypothetical protein|tara:strand:+ start:622 stop:1362 length:741 start_codon:yes stop_codon:yes gene_type:complete